jgi:GR25 family glycosyltransferase involved in LPS biosynthesis
MIISTYFDKIYYINLDKDTNRNVNIVEQFRKFDITNFHRIAGTVLKTIPDHYFWRNFNKPFLNEKYILGSLGCRNSHLRIMEDALINNYKKILILEDDIVFTQDPNKLLAQNKSILDDWDMLYFGGEIEPHYRNQIVGAYAYALNRNVIEETYYMLASSGMEVDNFYAKIIQHMSYNYNKEGKYRIRKIYPFNTIQVNFDFGSNIR